MCVCSAYAQVLDRRQQTLQLLLIPLHSFVAPPSMASEGDVWMGEHAQAHLSSPPTAAAGPRVIFRDTSDIWIHVSAAQDLTKRYLTCSAMDC